MFFPFRDALFFPVSLPNRSLSLPRCPVFERPVFRSSRALMVRLPLFALSRILLVPFPFRVSSHPILCSSRFVLARPVFRSLSPLSALRFALLFFQGIGYFVGMHLEGAGVTDCDHWHDDAGKPENR